MTRGAGAWIGCFAVATLLVGCATSTTARRSAPQAFAFDANASPEALTAIADSAVAAGEPDAARRALVRASELAPQSVRVRLAYGRYYTSILRFRDAKAEFDRASALEPRSPEPPYWLGVAYLKAGQTEDAFRAFGRVLRLDPLHTGARRGIRPLLEERYRAAGVPTEYATLFERPSVSRGEVGVILAVELGVDPDRTTWRSDAAHRVDWSGLDAAWGSRWLRAAVARGWIRPLADRELHLNDPLTRGSLALLLAEIQARSETAGRGSMSDTTATAARPGSGGLRTAPSFRDLGPGHYLARAAGRAAGLGLPPREDGRFDPQALATGYETLRVVRGLARQWGALPVVSGETDEAGLLR